MAPLHVIVDAVFLVALSLTALAGLMFGAWKRLLAERNMYLPVSRRVVSFAGVIAVAIQGASFAAFWCWPQISRDNVLLGEWARWSFASFVLAVPCVLAGKGASRWWLLSSSVLLFGISFFTALIP